jgi:hypothetical protein
VTGEQKIMSWEMAVRVEKTIAAVLHEAHRQQVEEVMDVLAERPEGRSYSQDLMASDLDEAAPNPYGSVGRGTAASGTTSMR